MGAIVERYTLCFCIVLLYFHIYCVYCVVSEQKIRVFLSKLVHQQLNNLFVGDRRTVSLHWLIFIKFEWSDHKWNYFLLMSYIGSNHQWRKYLRKARHRKAQSRCLHPHQLQWMEERLHHQVHRETMVQQKQECDVNLERLLCVFPEGLRM